MFSNGPAARTFSVMSLIRSANFCPSAAETQLKNSRSGPMPVKSSSSRTLNRAMGRSGRIWTAGFHDHALRKEEDVKRVARYVIANPLRAGLVEQIGDYPLWDAIWL